MATTDLERLVVQLSADVRSYERSLNKARQATNKTAGDIERRFNRVNKSLSTLGSGLGSALKGFGAGLASSLTISAIGDLIKQFGDLHDAAAKVGTDAESLQALGFAARQNGAEMEEVIDALGKLQRKVGEARQKQKGPLFEIFAANDKKFSDDAIENLKTIADLIQNAKTQADRFVIAQAAGKGMEKLIPLLQQGGAAIDDLMQKARDSGQVMSNDLVAKADDFSERWENAFKAFQVTGAAAVITVVDQVDKLIQQESSFGKFLEDLIRQNTIAAKLVEDIRNQRNLLLNLRLTGGGLLGALGVPEQSIFGGGELENAKNEVRRLETALEDAKADSGELPTTIEALNQQLEAAKAKVRELAAEFRKATGAAGSIGGAMPTTGPAAGRFFGGGGGVLGVTSSQFAKPTIIPQGVDDSIKEFDKVIQDATKGIIRFEGTLDPNQPNIGGRTSALGIGQITGGTFADLMRLHFPQIAAGTAEYERLRTDADHQIKLIALYAEDNAKVLKQFGVSVTAANLQLAHFLGPGGATKLLKADPNALASSVLGADQVAANPELLSGRTVAQVIAEANARSGLAGTIERQREALDELARSTQTNIDKAKLEVSLIGAKTEEIARQRAELEITRQLQEQGVDVNRPDVVAQIKAAADAEAQYAGAVEQAHTAQEKAAESAKRLEEAQQQAAQTAQQIADAFGSAFKGFISDLAQGKKLTDALRDALLNLGQSLLNIALDNLTNSLTSGLGGGAGLLGGLLHQGGIAGQASAHRLVPASAFAGAYRYHGGGFAGLRPGEVPAILKRGEPILESMDQLKGLVMAAKRGGMGPGYSGGAIVQNVQFIAPDVKTMARSRNQLARSAGTDLERVRRTL